MIEVWFDGFISKNPSGEGGIGVVIKQEGKIIHTISKRIGSGEYMSSNVAEYEGLRQALLYLHRQDLHTTETVIYGDSRLVIEQMKGNWKIKKGIYRITALKTKALVGLFSDICFEWLPRELNVLADILSKGYPQKTPPLLLENGGIRNKGKYGDG